MRRRQLASAELHAWPREDNAVNTPNRSTPSGEKIISLAETGVVAIRTAIFVVQLCLLSACAVGPDYQRPAVAVPQRLTEASLPGHTGSTDTRGGRDQSYVTGADIPGAWWQLFRSPELAALVTKAIARNPSLEAASAALRAAQENTLAQEGNWLPNLQGQFSRTRQELGLGEAGENSHLAGQPFPYTFSLYQASLNVSYTFDVWGQNTRSVEADRAAAESQAWQLEGAVNMLAANTVTAAITAASLTEQIKAEEALIGAEQQVLKTVRSQFVLGGATGADVAQQESQLGQTEALVVPLRTQLAQMRDQLAAYIGQAPADAAIPNITLDQLTLPGNLPVSVPARLLDQRPDIRNAEAQLHQAVANIGVAVANRLPQFTLQGYIGSQPGQVANLFTPGNGALYLLTQAMAPIFSGGQLLHKQRQAAALAKQALYTYENTVVTAYQNVADVLNALQGDASALEANRFAERAAARSFNLAQFQYKAGGVAYLTVLTAQTQYQNAVIGLIRAEAARYTDTASLYVALGGGWWNRQDLPKPPENLLRSLLP
jgi:NodT family efflux transporter outer membrane factor (OMF) lipoprotein